MARRAAYQKKNQNRFGMFLATAVILMMVISVAVKSIELKQTIYENNSKVESLRGQIAEEEKKTEEIMDYEKYTQTKKYIEDIAKDKLGLVYEGEIIFKSED